MGIASSSMKLLIVMCRNETGRMESVVDNIAPQVVCSHSHGSCSLAHATEPTASLLLLICFRLRHLNSSWRGHRHHHRCERPRCHCRLGICSFRGIGFRSICICGNQPSTCERILTFQNCFRWARSESHGCYLGSSHHRSRNDLGHLNVKLEIHCMWLSSSNLFEKFSFEIICPLMTLVINKWLPKPWHSPESNSGKTVISKTHATPLQTL